MEVGVEVIFDSSRQFGCLMGCIFPSTIALYPHIIIWGEVVGGDGVGGDGVGGEGVGAGGCGREGGNRGRERRGG